MNDMRRTKELAVLLLSLLLLMGMVPVQVFATAADNVESSLSADNSLSTLSLSAGTLSPSFQYNVTDYTASVGADVASVEVTAKTSNEFATVESISGNTDLQPGQNTVSVVVKAQNGATATYKIVVTKAQGAQQDQPQNVEPSVEEPEAPQEGQDSQQGQGGIAINGHSFDLAATVPDDVIPQDFTKDTVTCQGQQVECLRFEKGTLTLVYLTTPSTEVKNTLAVYEEASGTFYPFRRVSQGEASYLIILNPPAETGLPQEYALSDQSIGGFENVPAFVRAGSAPKAGEGIGGIQGAEGVESESTLAEGGFALIYAASSFGNIGWYSYDKAEATFQRYLPTGDSVKNPEGTDQSKEEPSVEMLGLQNAYKDLEEKYNQKKDSSRKITAVMIFVIAVLVIVIINLIIRNRKASEEEAYDDEPQGRNQKHLHKAQEMQRKEHGEGKRARKKEETEETPGIRKTSQRADRTVERIGDRKLTEPVEGFRKGAAKTDQTTEGSRKASSKLISSGASQYGHAAVSKGINDEEGARSGKRNPVEDMKGAKRGAAVYHTGDLGEGIGAARGLRKAAYEVPKMPKQPPIDDRKRDAGKEKLPSGGAFIPDSRPAAKQEAMKDDFEVIDLEDL